MLRFFRGLSLSDQDARQRTEYHFPPAPFIRLQNSRMRARSETLSKSCISTASIKYDKPLPPIPLRCVRRRGVNHRPTSRILRSPDVDEFLHLRDSFLFGHHEHDARVVDNQPSEIILHNDSDKAERADARAHAAHMILAYDFDLVYIVRLDLAALKRTAPVSRATVLAGCSSVDSRCLPESVPREMYGKFVESGGWRTHEAMELPPGFEYGFSYIFNRGVQPIRATEMHPVVILSCLYRTYRQQPLPDLFALDGDARIMMAYLSCIPWI